MHWSPSATDIAPVSVATSTSLFSPTDRAYAIASASTSLPSAVRVVYLDRLAVHRPHHVARGAAPFPLGIFSVAGTITVTLIFGFSSEIARIAPNHGRASCHIALHRQHAGSVLYVKSAAIEGNPLPQQPDVVRLIVRDPRIYRMIMNFGGSSLPCATPSSAAHPHLRHPRPLLDLQPPTPCWCATSSALSANSEGVMLFAGSFAMSLQKFHRLSNCATLMASLPQTHPTWTRRIPRRSPVTGRRNLHSTCTCRTCTSPSRRPLPVPGRSLYGPVRQCPLHCTMVAADSTPIPLKRRADSAATLRTSSSENESAFPSPATQHPLRRDPTQRGVPASVRRACP